MSEQADPGNESKQSKPFQFTGEKVERTAAPNYAEIAKHYKNKACELMKRGAIFTCSFGWQKIRRFIAIIDEHDGFVTALATAAIAYLTWSLATDSSRQAESAQGQFKVMREQLKEMKSSSEQVERAIGAANRQAAAAEDANRAWIAVGTAEIDGPWEQGKATKVKIEFVNSGREVATSVLNHVRAMPVPISKDFVFGETRVTAGPNPECDGVYNVQGGSLAFPDSRRDSWTEAPLKASDMSADVFSGAAVLVLQGCYSYLSGNVQKWTGYCFVVGTKDKHITAQSSPWCFDGNFAN